MNTITLNSKQIKQLNEIVEHFPDVNQFKLIVDHSSGIGPVVHVKFTLFAAGDTSVDITDVTEW